MGSPVDDALDRLDALVVYEAAKDALATVREALERQRRHPDAWSQEAFDQQKARAEAAEAEVQRYREGLREIASLAESTRIGWEASLPRDVVQSLRRIAESARALLADSPDGANTEGGEA